MAAESTELISDGDTVCRQIFEPRMREPYPNVSGAAYPSQFQFKVSGDGRRVESVIWKQRSSNEACYSLGVAKAEVDAGRKLTARPETPAEELPVYVGFFEADVARIRGVRHADDVYCEPGVFEVLHEPEGDVYAHAHIVLLDGFLEALKGAMTAEMGSKASLLSEKVARQHAINMLLRVVEKEPLCRVQVTLSPAIAQVSEGGLGGMTC